jgi:hypothetical protein
MYFIDSRVTSVLFYKPCTHGGFILTFGKVVAHMVLLYSRPQTSQAGMSLNILILYIDRDIPITVLNDKSEGQYKTGKGCPCALIKHHAIKEYWGNGGIAPLIL